MAKFLVVYVVAIILATSVAYQREPPEIPWCSIVGDKYTTFDGKEYSVSGDREAAHYLLKGDELIVEVDNRCHGSCAINGQIPRALIIRTHHSTIMLRNEIHVNGTRQHLPWTTQDHSKQIKIEETATNDLIVDLWNGFLIIWKKGSYVYISVPTSHKQREEMMKHGFKLRILSASPMPFKWRDRIVSVTDADCIIASMRKINGMCGIYNGNPNDDFTCPLGGLAPSVSYFERAWRTNDKQLPAAFRRRY